MGSKTILERSSKTIFLIPEKNLTRDQRDQLTENGISVHKFKNGYRYANISIENLKLINEIIGRRNIEYDASLYAEVRYLRQQSKNIREAQKIKTMNKHELYKMARELNLEFPETYPPFLHQIRGLLFLWLVARAGLYYDAGLGKTYINALLIENMKKQGIAKNMLVICPANIIELGWMDDIYKYTDLKAKDGRVQSGSKREKVQNMETGEDIILQSFNGFRALTSYFRRKGAFDIICLDESSIVKNWTGGTTKAVKEAYCPRIVLASGTPAPNSYIEYFSQAWVIGQVLGNTLGAFREKYMFQPNVEKAPHFWVWKSNRHEERVLEKLDPYVIYAKQSEWIDAPDRMEVPLYYDLTPKQKKHYKEVEEEYFTIIEDEEIYIRSAMNIKAKLAQVINGFLFPNPTEENPNPDPIPIENPAEKTPKFVRMKEKVEQILANPENNIVIWARFKHDIKVIAKMLKKYNPAVVYGGTSPNKKIKELKRWKNDDLCRVIISNPKSTKFGHTWLKANYMFWFSVTESYEDYYQASMRNSRIGQEHKSVVDIRMIAIDTIDPDLYRAVEQKRDLRDVTFDRKGGRSGCTGNTELSQD
ncbi:MAG: DEAD/DEAH box helicase [Halobacteriota archaeon]|nr:DEAD/DEAH box helicase [Halobacteriota archaeon]